MASGTLPPPPVGVFDIVEHYRDTVYSIRNIFEVTEDDLKKYEKNILNHFGRPERLSSSYLKQEFSVKELELFFYTFLGKFLDDTFFQKRVLSALLKFEVIDKEKHDKFMEELNLIESDNIEMPVPPSPSIPTY